jgi:hypothetical protein
MRPVEAQHLAPCDVIHAHGGTQIITDLRTWRGVTTATLLGAPPISWHQHDIVLTSHATPITRGEGIGSHGDSHQSTSG